MRINPKGLQELKCPVCSKELTYFVPYDLHKEIYNIVRSHDGLLLDAYAHVLKENNISYRLNQKFLEDLEVDCIFTSNGVVHIVESKMYRQNTTKDKLRLKMRGHFGKLISDVEKLENVPEFNNAKITPILLINIIDTTFIKEIEEELKNEDISEIAQSARILNLESIITK